MLKEQMVLSTRCQIKMKNEITINPLTESVVRQEEETGPAYQMEDGEFENQISALGSFLTVVKNKKINPTHMVLILFEDIEIRKFFIKLTGVDNFESLMYNILRKYPQLCKSKTVKTKILAYAKYHRKKYL